MAELTQKIELLLDRLYNLKGEDNIVLKELASKIEETESKIDIEEVKKNNSEINKVNCEGTLELFLMQKQTFEEAFQGLDNQTFSALREIDVNLEIGSLLAAISERSPEYCERLQNEIKLYEAETNEALEQKANLEEELSFLNNKKSSIENDREQLISLLEQSLSPNEIERDSLTAHYVKRIISPFEVFEEDELAKLTKLIMFPDEGLYQFDQTYEERLKNGLVNIEQEYNEEVSYEEAEEQEVVEETIAVNEINMEVPENEEETENVEEETEENNIEQHAVEEAQEIYGHEEDKASIIDLTSLNRHEENEIEEKPVVLIKETTHEEIPQPLILDVEEPQAEDVEEAVVEEAVEIEETPEEIFEKKLINIGLDVEKLKSNNEEDINEIYDILNSVEERTINENFEILRSISLDDEAYKIHNGHMYLADTEFNKKLTLLRAKGISEGKIQELIDNANSGLRESFEVIEERIKSIQKIHQRVEDDNIKLLKYNVAQYENNLNILATNGYELDEKEIRNHNLLLFESNNINTNVEILKDYLISIVRNNGKYALPIFWKKPIELLTDIDSLIEADLENVISTNPEILGINTSELIKRVKYCEEKGEPIYEGNAKTDFCKHIVSYYDFYNKYGSSNIMPELISIDEVNSSLPNIVGNEELITILQSEYNNIENIIGLEVLPEIKDEFNRFKHLIEDKYQAVVIGKYTYKLGHVFVSKNKFERNLAILLNNLSSDKTLIDKLEKEIIFSAALFNLRQTEETLKKIVNN